MRREIIELIQTDRDLHRFIREQPQWYRILSRNPGSIQKFQRSAKQYLNKTFPQRIQKISEGAQMASLMLSMLQPAEKEGE